MQTENHTLGQATSPDRSAQDATDRAPDAIADRPPGAAARPALDEARLRRALVRPGGLWRAVEVTGRTGSTNADLLARAPAGAPEGVVLVADDQSAGPPPMGPAPISPPPPAPP